MFDLAPGKDGTSGIRWSGTNHVEGGNLLLLDGSLVAAGDRILRQQTANRTGAEGRTLLLLVPW